ncbi:MAG: hypothetical protein QHG99_08005 [Methanomicrobiales archaeon]|nr:hypothetical protein [Methanomicrobiales archaeon]
MPIICLLFMSVNVATGHAPSNLRLTYDGEVLQASFTHEVDNPAVHYISRVEVKAEGIGTLLQREYTSQPTRDIFTYNFSIALPPGSIVRVKADCNIGGRIQQEISVPIPPTSLSQTTIGTFETPAETEIGRTTPPPVVTPTTTAAPGFLSVVPLLATALAGLAFVRRRSN